LYDIIIIISSTFTTRLLVLAQLCQATIMYCKKESAMKTLLTVLCILFCAHATLANEVVCRCNQQVAMDRSMLVSPDYICRPVTTSQQAVLELPEPLPPTPQQPAPKPVVQKPPEPQPVVVVKVSVTKEVCQKPVVYQVIMAQNQTTFPSYTAQEACHKRRIIY
jgi:hypothetical protein